VIAAATDTLLGSIRFGEDVRGALGRLYRRELLVNGLGAGSQDARCRFKSAQVRHVDRY
jgi:hypothetical protein